MKQKQKMKNIEAIRALEIEELHTIQGGVAPIVYWLGGALVGKWVADGAEVVLAGATRTYFDWYYADHTRDWDRYRGIPFPTN